MIGSVLLPFLRHFGLFIGLDFVYIVLLFHIISVFSGFCYCNLGLIIEAFWTKEGFCLPISHISNRMRHLLVFFLPLRFWNVIWTINLFVRGWILAFALAVYYNRSLKIDVYLNLLLFTIVFLSLSVFSRRVNRVLDWCQV